MNKEFFLKKIVIILNVDKYFVYKIDAISILMVWHCWTLLFDITSVTNLIWKSDASPAIHTKRKSWRKVHLATRTSTNTNDLRQAPNGSCNLNLNIGNKPLHIQTITKQRAKKTTIVSIWTQYFVAYSFHQHGIRIFFFIVFVFFHLWCLVY